MRPVLCAGGYPLPIKSGKCKVVGFSCSTNVAATASRLTLKDDDPFKSGGIPMPTEDSQLKDVLIDKKGMASVDVNLAEHFIHPITFVNGICLVNASNLLVGRLIVYIE
jgi:hypothetical protein